MNRLTNHLVMATLLLVCVTPAPAATLTWSGGGSGTWNTTGTNWTPATTDPWDATNGSSNIAAFGGTATVTVADTVYANGMNFTGATTVTGGTITLTGTDPTVTFSTLATSPARLDSQLSGSGGLTIASSATGINTTNRLFVLEGSQSNTFGDLTIRNTNTTGTSAWQFHQLAKTSGASALSGNLFIDGGNTAANLTVVYLVTASSLPTGATVNLNSDGGYTRFLLNAYATGGSSVEIGGLASTGTAQANTVVNATWEGGTQPTTTLTINNSSDYAFAGILQNNVGTGVSPLAIVKNGAGTQTFTGGNLHTGGTTISGGTLRIGSNTGLGSGAVVVNANGTLALNPGVVATNTITGTGTITVSGSGTSFGNLSPGVSGFGGTINVNTTGYWTGITGSAGEYGSATAKWVVDRGVTASTFALYPNAANGTVKLGELSGNGAVAGSNFAGTTVFEVGGLGTDSTYGGALRDATLGGAGAFSRLLKVGSGRLTLAGANSYTGGTTIDQGTVVVSNANALGAYVNGRPVSQVVVNSGGAVDFNGVINATYGYTIAGTGPSGAGALTNSGAAITTASAQASNILLAANASIGGSGDWALLTNLYAATSLDLAGHTLTKTGANTISLASTTTTAGTITIAQGTLAAGVSNGGTGLNAAASAVTLDNVAGATFSLARSASIGSLAGGGSTGGTVSLGGNTLTAGGLNTDSIFSGQVIGTNGAIVKVGSGRLTLSNTNSYTGATSVDAGTLAVNGSIATSSGVSVASGATLGGSGFVSAVSGAGRIAPGNSAGILTAPSVDPTLGTSFAFEFGATGSPNYADATASVNDVLHLTGGTPLSSSLTGSNAIDVYFNVATLGAGDTFRGGAYIDANVDFLAQVADATYAYYVLGDGNGPTNGYYTLAQYDPSLSISLSTVSDAAAFSGGSESGRVMEFQAVPEPSTLALFAGGLLVAGTLARRRRAG